MDIDQAFEHALNGDAILFVGAGFSLGAKNLRDQPFKAGGTLAAYFANAVSLPNDTTLENAAEEFIRIQGVDKLIFELQQEFTVSEIHNRHIEIAKIPWKRIYTSNYDDVLEVAYAENRKRLTPVTPSDKINSILKRSPVNADGKRSLTLCVHLNGYINRLNSDTLGSEFKLTDSSYASESILSNPWTTLFRQDLSTARAVFFIGYSLADLDIKRILYATPSLTEKTFFVLRANPDTISLQRALKYGSVLPYDAAGFVTAIEDKRRTYSPPIKIERIGYCIQKFKAPTAFPAASDRLIFDLFLYGLIQPALVWSGFQPSGPHYLRERQIATLALEHLDRSRAMVLHSDLGNGKTAILEGIKCRAFERGYEVYTLSRRTDDLTNELEEVLEKSGKTLLVIDDYPAWLDAIEFIGTHAKSDLRILLTARSVIHDVMIGRLTGLLDNIEIQELAVDLLDVTDLKWIDELFVEFGLWGDKAGWSQDRKLAYLQRTCKSQFHAVLLTILESQQIITRLYDILEEVKEKRTYYDVVISVLVLAVINFHTSIEVLTSIWGERILDAQFKNNLAVKQLIDVQQGRILLRSAAAAEFILTRITDAETITQVMTHMSRIADRSTAASPLYWGMLTALMRFSNLQLLLPEEQRTAAVVRYYESIKNLNGCKNNPQFWLQYAIASVTSAEYERAEKYFQTSYALANERVNYDTHMIDNHFARYLLLRAIHENNPSTCMTVFQKVRHILNEQVKKERIHFPYRVASHYVDFYDTFSRHLTAAQKVEIARAAQYIAERIEQLPAERRRNNYVQKCSEAMKYLVTTIQSET